MSDIPSAPRGVPQVEVTFDIDANGIVNVSAKDLGTGKEQKITIQSSSGLSESEIQKMVDEAQRHAEDDKGRREVIDTRNKLDGLIFQVEKNLKDNGDKVTGDVKSALEQELKNARQVLETKAEDKVALSAAVSALEQKAYKLAEEMYKNAGPQGGAPGAGPEAGGPTGSAKKDGVVDAEFEST